MERRRYRQQHALFHAELAAQRHRTLDRALVAREHDLPGGIVIGDGANLALGRLLGNRLRLIERGAEQRRHRTDADGHRRLHRPPAQLQQPRRGRQIERAGGTKGGILPQRMASDERGMIGQLHPALALQHAQRGNRVGHDCGLGIFGQRQVRLRPFGHKPEQILADRFIDFLKHVARGGAGGGEIGPHAHRLAALAGKNERAHRSLHHHIAWSGGPGRNACPAWQAPLLFTPIRVLRPLPAAMCCGIK